MPFKFARDEFRFCANEMKNLDDMTVTGHGAPGGKDNCQNGCCHHKRQDACTNQHRRIGHRNKSVDPCAMVVKTCARNGAGNFSAHGFKIGRCVLVDGDNDQTRNRQFINVKPTAKPWLKQASGRILVDDAGIFHTRKAARNAARVLQCLVHIKSVNRTDLDGRLARNLALPLCRRSTHQSHATKGEAGKKCHDRNHNH